MDGAFLFLEILYLPVMMNKAPNFLKKGDKVAIIATAKNFEKKELETSIRILQSWGLEVVLGKNLYKKENQFAGTDPQRLEDLQWALDTKDIKAIFCARGGYGTARIIDGVDWSGFIKAPKWLIGFSDVTVLLSEIQLQKIQCIHGPMPILFATKGYELSLKKLQETLFGKAINYKITPQSINRMGEATGELTGGNLAILCSLLGTPSQVDTKNKILFIEDVGENLYRVDRMMVQLKRAAVLESLAGLIVGHFTAMEDNAVRFGKSAQGIIADAVSEYKYPVCYGFPAGHEPDNLPLILGTEIRLSVKKTYCLID